MVKGIQDIRIKKGETVESLVNRQSRIHTSKHQMWQWGIFFNAKIHNGKVTLTDIFMYQKTSDYLYETKTIEDAKRHRGK